MLSEAKHLWPSSVAGASQLIRDSSLTQNDIMTIWSVFEAPTVRSLAPLGMTERVIAALDRPETGTRDKSSRARSI